MLRQHKTWVLLEVSYKAESRFKKFLTYCINLENVN